MFRTSLPMPGAQQIEVAASVLGRGLLDLLPSRQEAELDDVIGSDPILLHQRAADRCHDAAEGNFRLRPPVTTCDDVLHSSPLAQRSLVRIGDPHQGPLERLLGVPAADLDTHCAEEEVLRRRAGKVVHR
jgi:hypothetical protein